jgi:hypothetical protein
MRRGNQKKPKTNEFSTLPSATKGILNVTNTKIIIKCVYVEPKQSLKYGF